MKKRCVAVVLLACVGTFLGACKAREEVRPEAQEVPAVAVPAATEVPSPAPAAEPAPVEPAAAAADVPAAEPAPMKADPPAAAPRPAPAAAPASIPAAAPTVAAAVAPPKAAVPATAPIPAAVAPTAPPSPTAAPAPPPKAASSVVDPGGEVVVPSGKAGATRVGVDKCKVCHKVQYTSWAASGHAKRTPPLDCEGCHGPGSEYKALSVMKDPAKAKAAGLVEPGAAFCARCHPGELDPSFFVKVHAHKKAP